jgi:O-antigen/teichoic acid export membrane protein
MGAGIRRGSGGVIIKYRNYVSLAMATALAQGFLFLVSPVVTRMYSPEHFGGFGLLLGVGAVIASVGTGRLEHAIPVSRSVVQALRIFMLGVALMVALALIATLVIAGLRFSQLLTGTAWARLPLRFIPLLAISLAMFQLSSALLLRQKSYARVGINKVLQGLATGLLQLAFGFAGIVSLGLILAQALGYLAGCAAGLRRLIPRLIVIATRHGFALVATLRAYRRFPLVLAPAALLNQASQQFPILAIGYIYGLHEAGLYALALRVCGAPLALIGQAVAQVYAGEFRILSGKASGAVARHYRTLLASLLVIGVLVVSGLVTALKLGDQIVFGRAWSRLGDTALALTLMLVFDFATTPISMTLGYLEKQSYQLYWDICRLGAVVLVFVVTFLAALRFEQALILLSVAWAASLAVHTYITYQACREHAERRVKFAATLDQNS